jgi:hypothetical protein
MPRERRQVQVLVRRPLFWNAALPLKPPPHALVPEIDRIAEHERAAPDDAVDAVRVTLANGLV